MGLLASSKSLFPETRRRLRKLPGSLSFIDRLSADFAERELNGLITLPFS